MWHIIWMSNWGKASFQCSAKCLTHFFDVHCPDNDSYLLKKKCFDKHYLTGWYHFKKYFRGHLIVKRFLTIYCTTTDWLRKIYLSILSQIDQLVPKMNTSGNELTFCCSYNSINSIVDHFIEPVFKNFNEIYIQFDTIYRFSKDINIKRFEFLLYDPRTLHRFGNRSNSMSCLWNNLISSSVTNLHMV